MKSADRNLGADGLGSRGRLGFGVTAALDAATLQETARSVARLGYTSFWVNDDGRSADGLAALAHVHEATPKIALGIGVLPLDRWTPDEIVARVAALGLPVEGLYLGLGAGTGPDPIERVRRGVAAVRSELPTARIFIAALGARMCQLGGEIADGVLLNWMTPDGIRSARREIAVGEERSERRSTTQVWAYVRAAVGDRASDRVTLEAQRYQRLAPHYAQNFERQGVSAHEMGLGATPTPFRIRQFLEVLDGLVIRALPSEPRSAELSRIAAAAMRAYQVVLNRR
jgi:alkanesulfonate monooxygenase SsuD/methylene tetrahydromethanopterin reductase-like flavin-dependent oxidoreductase (luciferase family)